MNMSDVKIRDWSSFVDTKAFGVPASGEEAISRVKHNTTYFKANYAIVAGVILAITLYFNPQALWVVGIPAGAAAGLFLSPNLVVQGHRFTDMEKLAIVSFVFLFVMWLTGTSSVVYTFAFFSTVVLLVHSVFRKKSIKSTVSNFVDTSTNKVNSTIDKVSSKF